MATAHLKQSEKQFEAAVVEFAKLNGWKVFHPFDSRRSEAGWPDLTLVRDGWLVFAELKTEKGALSRKQREWLEALQIPSWRLHTRPGYEEALMLVRVWRPSDWPEIERVLARRPA